MSLVVYGAKALQIEDLGEVIADRYGLETASVQWKIAYADATDKGAVLPFLPAIGSAHPILSYLTCVRRRTKFEPGLARIACDYEGVGADTTPVYTLEAGLSEEPIETHPNFYAMAGKPSAPRNGAIFSSADDETGVFQGFAAYRDFAGTPVLNNFGGISSFLDFSKAVWTATYYSPNKPSDALTAMGTINTPIGEPPDFGTIQFQYYAGGTIYSVSRRNWLYMGVALDQRGSAYQLKHQWMLSGLGGWNQSIYNWTADDVIDEG